MTSTPSNSFLKRLSITAVAASALLLSGQASAETRCTSKPAVCMRLKAQQAHKEAQGKTQAPTAPKADLAARCTSKPAVCMRLKAQEADRAATPPPKVTPRPPRCTTKPAICMRLKQANH